jgi:hypothetical protein
MEIFTNHTLNVTAAAGLGFGVLTSASLSMPATADGTGGSLAVRWMR